MQERWLRLKGHVSPRKREKTLIKGGDIRLEKIEVGYAHCSGVSSKTKKERWCCLCGIVHAGITVYRWYYSRRNYFMSRLLFMSVVLFIGDTVHTRVIVHVGIVVHAGVTVHPVFERDFR